MYMYNLNGNWDVFKMTNAELIKVLSMFNSDAQVLISFDDRKQYWAQVKEVDTISRLSFENVVLIPKETIDETYLFRKLRSHSFCIKILSASVILLAIGIFLK